MKSFFLLAIQGSRPILRLRPRLNQVQDLEHKVHVIEIKIITQPPIGPWKSPLEVKPSFSRQNKDLDRNLGVAETETQIKTKAKRINNKKELMENS